MTAMLLTAAGCHRARLAAAPRPGFPRTNISDAERANVLASLFSADPWPIPPPALLLDHTSGAFAEKKADVMPLSNPPRATVFADKDARVLPCTYLDPLTLNLWALVTGPNQPEGLWVRAADLPRERRDEVLPHHASATGGYTMRLLYGAGEGLAMTAPWRMHRVLHYDPDTERVLADWGDGLPTFAPLESLCDAQRADARRQTRAPTLPEGLAFNRRHRRLAQLQLMRLCLSGVCGVPYRSRTNRHFAAALLLENPSDVPCLSVAARYLRLLRAQAVHVRNRWCSVSHDERRARGEPGYDTSSDDDSDAEDGRCHFAAAQHRDRMGVEPYELPSINAYQFEQLDRFRSLLQNEFDHARFASTVYMPCALDTSGAPLESGTSATAAAHMLTLLEIGYDELKQRRAAAMVATLGHADPPAATNDGNGEENKETNADAGAAAAAAAAVAAAGAVAAPSPRERVRAAWEAHLRKRRRAEKRVDADAPAAAAAAPPPQSVAVPLSVGIPQHRSALAIAMARRSQHRSHFYPNGGNASDGGEPDSPAEREAATGATNGATSGV